MIGYHYTTWEAYQKIKFDHKVKLSPLPEHHYEDCLHVLEFVKDGCIWVYLKPFTELELIGQIIYMSIRKSVTRIVCLELSYTDSATVMANNDTDEYRNIHSLTGFGMFGHKNVRFDLITKPVSDFVFGGQWDLEDIL